MNNYSKINRSCGEKKCKKNKKIKVAIVLHSETTLKYRIDEQIKWLKDQRERLIIVNQSKKTNKKQKTKTKTKTKQTDYEQCKICS